MSNTKSWLLKYWQTFTAAALVIFNIGYTVARLEEKPSREEVTKSVKTSIYEYDKEIRDNYTEIKRVPGLKETLESINEKLKNLDDRLNKWEERIFYKNNVRN